MSKYRNVTEYLQKFASDLFLWTTVVQPQFFFEILIHFWKPCKSLQRKTIKKNENLCILFTAWDRTMLKLKYIWINASLPP